MKLNRRMLLHNHGFTLVELMVVVALIGIVSGVVVVISANEWRRDRINAVAVEFAGWLEEVRSASLREVNNNGCTVTFASTTLTSVPAGTQLASINPAVCQGVPQANFLIPGITATADRYSATSTASAITFTPRGSVTSTTNVLVNLSLDNSIPLRCVRISPTVGLIRIGSNNAATGVAGTCTFNTF